LEDARAFSTMYVAYRQRESARLALLFIEKE